jgi:hypothetical protein
MFDRPSPESALSRLQHGEICVVVLHDGSKREAKWESEERQFSFWDGKGDGAVRHDKVYEWWPASVKF